MRMFHWVAAVAAAVTLLGVGCSGGGATSTSAAGSPTPAAAAATAAAPKKTEITVTDIVGRKVKVQAPVEKMILSEGRILYIVAPLDKENPFKHVVGWADDLRINDFDTYQKYQAKFPDIAKVPVYGSVANKAFSAEKAIAEKPDLMVMTYDSYIGARDSGLIEKLEAAGIPSMVIDFRQYPLENTIPSIQLMGRVMGQDERAQKMTDFYTTQVNLVYSRIDKLDPKRVKPTTFVYRAAGLSDCCGTFGNGNMGLLIDRAGGANIGTKFLPGWSGTLNPEQVIASNPDIIVVTGSNWKNSRPEGGFVNMGYGTSKETAGADLKKLVERAPGWSGLDAVKNQKVYAVWHQFYISPYAFVPLMQFAKWQYPAEFADVDPGAVFKAFHEQFLPIEYSGTFTAAIQ